MSSVHSHMSHLDLGATKLRFCVFDQTFKNKFLEVKSINLNDNNVNNFNEINNIIKKAEKKNEEYIEDIILALDHKQLFTIDLSLQKKLNNKIIITKVLDSLILEIRQIIDNFYNNYEVAHLLLDKYITDDETYLDFPTYKKEINNIKAQFKLICFPKKLIIDLQNNFNKNNINITNIFCSSYLKSLSYLKKLNLEKSTFLEIGSNRSSFLSFNKNKLKFIQPISIGGNHITKDISKVFNITLEEAEKIKRSFNKSETEFSYANNKHETFFTAKDIINKKISIDLLKKVILYRVQEIIDLSFKKTSSNHYKLNLRDTDLFLIGDGSVLFNNNSFYLDDKLALFELIINLRRFMLIFFFD